eukprot:tig00020816_g14162.t1
MADNRTLEEVVAPVKAWLGPRGGRKRVELLCNGPLAAAAKTALAGALVVHVPALQAACELLLAMVILLGATNVGKSTLCNAFVGSVVLPAVPQSESAVPTAVEHVERAGPPVLTGLQGGTRVELERGDGPIYKRLKKMSEDAREDRTGAKAREMREMELRVEASIGFAARGSAAVPGVRFRLLDCAGVGEAGAGHLARETAGAGARSDFVVFVLSYTDLANAEAFRRLGDLLRERPDLTDRIVVVVNKIDQYRPAEEGGLKPADVPARVVRMLRTETGVEVPEGAVVCVAGRKALLARRFLAGEATANEKDELFADRFGEQWAQTQAPELRAYAEHILMESGLPALEARLVATVVQNRALLVDAAAGRLRSGLAPLAEGVKALFDAVSGEAAAAEAAAGEKERALAVARGREAEATAAAVPSPAAAAGRSFWGGTFFGRSRRRRATRSSRARSRRSPPARRSSRGLRQRGDRRRLRRGEGGRRRASRALRDRAERPGQAPPSEDEAARAARAAAEAASGFLRGAMARLAGNAAARFAKLAGSSAEASLELLSREAAEAAAKAAEEAVGRAAEAEARRWLAGRARDLQPVPGAAAVRPAARQELQVVQRPEDYMAAVPTTETYLVPVPYQEEVPHTVFHIGEEQRERRVMGVEHVPAPQPRGGGGFNPFAVLAPIAGFLFPPAVPFLAGLGAVTDALSGGEGGAGAPGPGMIAVPVERTVVETVQVLQEEQTTRTETRVRHEERTRPALQLQAAQRLRDVAEVVDVAGHVVDGAALAEALRGPCTAIRDELLSALPGLFSSAAVAAAARREAAAAALPALRAARAAAEEAEGRRGRRWRGRGGSSRRRRRSWFSSCKARKMSDRILTFISSLPAAGRAALPSSLVPPEPIGRRRLRPAHAAPAATTQPRRKFYIGEKENAAMARRRPVSKLSEPRAASRPFVRCPQVIAVTAGIPSNQTEADDAAADEAAEAEGALAAAAAAAPEFSPLGHIPVGEAGREVRIQFRDGRLMQFVGGRWFFNGEAVGFAAVLCATLRFALTALAKLILAAGVPAFAASAALSQPAANAFWAVLGAAAIKSGAAITLFGRARADFAVARALALEPVGAFLSGSAPARAVFPPRQRARRLLSDRPGRGSGGPAGAARARTATTATGTAAATAAPHAHSSRRFYAFPDPSSSPFVFCAIAVPFPFLG